MNKVTISTTEASKILEMDRATLEAWIRQGNCPFGVYVRKEGNAKGSYHIFTVRLEAYLKAKDMKNLTV